MRRAEELLGGVRVAGVDPLGLVPALDDQAAAPLPADSQITAGTYRPTDDDNDTVSDLASELDVSIVTIRRCGLTPAGSFGVVLIG